jgi:hypothetical protein
MSVSTEAEGAGEDSVRQLAIVAKICRSSAIQLSMESQSAVTPLRDCFRICWNCSRQRRHSSCKARLSLCVTPCRRMGERMYG